MEDDRNEAYNRGQTPFWYGEDGREHCDEETAVAELLREGVLFLNQRPYVHGFPKERWPEKADGDTMVLFVNCSDVFAWACADLTFADIPRLYRLWKEHGGDGVTKWACLRRRQKPQLPVERELREAGLWDEEMEALPANTQDAETQAIFALARQKFGNSPQEKP